MHADDPRGGSAAPRLTRVARIFGWLAGHALVLFVLDLLGVPVADWIRQLFKEVRAVPPAAIAGGIVLETLQTVFAYDAAEVKHRELKEQREARRAAHGRRWRIRR